MNSDLDKSRQIPLRLVLIIPFVWKRLAREQQPLSLILFDVNKFKSYNDFYGHLAGDDCLIRIAQTVQTVIWKL
ncbi:diguanylate cyclase [Nodularia spumigena CENA596]|jgi:diguanylate cyclase (GGDEF)-like protein|uniref:Diguanylate cyclase n=1 Tax=Nodularia spumigena CENA596 TaxID=1819295 RepID=A0A161XXU1_NODSP|nr:Two-component response regulator [Nodularia spumigena CCY9414]EAW44194.1 Putative diguanylate cyclase (GGDEF domain) [Nodularia spumigena CCY9414]KZL47659.1 diguanylate cyclase [Nodularia spumigena CENA596]